MYLLASAYLLESINQSEIKSKYWFQEDKLFFQPQNTPILAKKSLKLHFLQNFPGFHFVFNCSDSVHMWTIISHWQNTRDTSDLVVTSHRHRGGCRWCYFRQISFGCPKYFQCLNTFGTWIVLSYFFSVWPFKAATRASTEPKLDSIDLCYTWKSSEHFGLRPWAWQYEENRFLGHYSIFNSTSLSSSTMRWKYWNGFSLETISHWWQKHTFDAQRRDTIQLG